MFNLIKKKEKSSDILKRNVLKNNEAMLDVMAESIKGARQCPYLMGNKCIGPLCEHFMQFFKMKEKGEKEEFWRCAHVQMPLLLIELNTNIKALIQKMEGANVKVDN